MNVIKLTMMFVVALSVVVPVAAAPVTPDSGGIEEQGFVESYSDGVLKVNGVTFIVNDSTLIITGRGKGNPASLDAAVGVWVSVSGYTDADEQVVARKVKVKPWQNGQPDPEDAPEDAEKPNPAHPVAVWIGGRFDLDYDALMAMHDAGIGWGTIVKAYHLARFNPEVTGSDLIDRRLEGEGWGNIARELGMSPGKVPPAWGRDKERNPNAAPKP